MDNFFYQELQQKTDEEVWEVFALSKKELRKRNLVRTNNIVGERGEFLTIETYNKTPNLPKLQAAPEGTQNVDALSRKGDRFSVKTITEPGKTTGVFYGCGDLNDQSKMDKKFEYVVIVVIDGDFKLKKMLELTWDQFIKLRKWHKTMRAWNLSITKNLIDEAKTIY